MDEGLPSSSVVPSIHCLGKAIGTREGDGGPQSPDLVVLVWTDWIPLALNASPRQPTDVTHGRVAGSKFAFMWLQTRVVNWDGLNLQSLLKSENVM